MGYHFTVELRGEGRKLWEGTPPEDPQLGNGTDEDEDTEDEHGT